MQVKKISTTPNPNFRAQISRDENIISAFEYARKLVDTNKPSKLKEVEKFCYGVRNILEYKPNEQLNLKFDKTIYSHITVKGVEPMFVYDACEANVSNDTFSKHYSERASHPKHQIIASAKLCFDSLKNFGMELVEGVFKGNKATSGEINKELALLSECVLGKTV